MYFVLDHDVTRFCFCMGLCTLLSVFSFLSSVKNVSMERGRVITHRFDLKKPKRLTSYIVHTLRINWESEGSVVMWPINPCISILGRHFHSLLSVDPLMVVTDSGRILTVLVTESLLFIVSFAPPPEAKCNFPAFLNFRDSSSDTSWFCFTGSM